MSQMNTDVAARELPESIDAIMAWRSDEVVRRYCADHNASAAEGGACFAAFKQFMIVCASSESIKAPSEAVDEMWHTALLFTRSYQGFCERYLGAFIHHQPVEQRADATIYDETMRLGERLFERLDDRYWPATEAVARCGGCGSVYVP
jgi:hypothetical protein